LFHIFSTFFFRDVKTLKVLLSSQDLYDGQIRKGEVENEIFKERGKSRRVLMKVFAHRKMNSKKTWHFSFFSRHFLKKKC